MFKTVPLVIYFLNNLITVVLTIIVVADLTPLFFKRFSALIGYDRSNQLELFTIFIEQLSEEEIKAKNRHTKVQVRNRLWCVDNLSILYTDIAA